MLLVRLLFLSPAAGGCRLPGSGKRTAEMEIKYEAALVSGLAARGNDTESAQTGGVIRRTVHRGAAGKQLPGPGTDQGSGAVRGGAVYHFTASRKQPTANGLKCSLL